MVSLPLPEPSSHWTFWVFPGYDTMNMFVGVTYLPFALWEEDLTIPFPLAALFHVLKTLANKIMSSLPSELRTVFLH